MREITKQADGSYGVTIDFTTPKEVLVVEEYDTPIRDVTVESDVKRFGFNGHSFFAVTSDKLKYTIHTNGTHQIEAEVNLTSETDVLNRYGPTTIGFSELPAVVGDAQPTDVDGDGSFEDINGDGTVTVADVQALFANLDSDVVENNPEAFDFNGDTRVSIADVQALFADLIH
jgi:hypothetical protein